jgi:hypothetical protein
VKQLILLTTFTYEVWALCIKNDGPILYIYLYIKFLQSKFKEHFIGFMYKLLAIHYSNKNQGFTRLSVTNKTFDWINTMILSKCSLTLRMKLLWFSISTEVKCIDKVVPVGDILTKSLDIFWLCYAFCLLHIVVGGKIKNNVKIYNIHDFKFININISYESLFRTGENYNFLLRIPIVFT